MISHEKIALFLSLVLCLSFMVPFAVSAETIEVTFEVLDEQPQRTPGKDCYEDLNNGSFEIMDSETALNAWEFTSDKGRANTRVGGEYANRSTDAHSGEYSVRISVSAETKYCDLIYGAAVKAGQVYEFSVWQKKLADEKAGFVNILFQGNDKNGTLSASLKPWEAVVWKVTPTGAALDASHLKTSKFRDTIYYPWAYNAISVLEEKGIINRVSNNWYGPQYNITRGDYAMFLVRALGLSAAAGENFVDVDPNAEYAKELAIGKAAGIIKTA